MHLFVNPTITGFRQEVDGTIKELKLGEAKEDAYANIIEQGGAKLENNKAATINVSTYTQPVEVTPSSGKDGMKKATITLSNIPSGANPSLTPPAWYTEQGNSVVPNGVQCVAYEGSGDTLIVEGDGVKTINQLVYNGFLALIASYGDSIVFRYISTIEEG